MNLSKFFIDRPIFAGVLSLLILVAGLLSLRVLPISEYPEVVPPQVVVHAVYPGASPAVVAEGRDVTYDLKADRDDPTAVGTKEFADAVIKRMAA